MPELFFLAALAGLAVIVAIALVKRRRPSAGADNPSNGSRGRPGADKH